MNNSVQIYEPNHFGNGWGFYVDIETPYSTIDKHGFVKEKYRKNYYNSREDKIDEELEYYEYEYNKKMEQQALEASNNNIIKTNSSSLLFHISSITIITAAVSYCFMAAL